MVTATSSYYQRLGVVVMSGSTRAASTNTAFARTAAAHPRREPP